MESKKEGRKGICLNGSDCKNEKEHNLLSVERKR